jgi:hypothetical protein
VNYGPPIIEAINRLESDACACEFVTTAVHFYAEDKNQLAADIRLVLSLVNKQRELIEAIYAQ